MALTVAFIGTGKKAEKASLSGYAMAYTHAQSYEALDGVEMVAACDLVEENVQAFAEKWGIDATFEDYNEMLKKIQPDIVSICTWPHLHEQMTVDCARAGVGLIYCEKPIADTIGGARRMIEVCDEEGAMLCFNHQRRYGAPFGIAKQMLDEGAIGELQRMEWGGANIYDYGSHNFDMAQFFNGETPAKSVIAQVDYHTESFWFGAHNENACLALIEYENGVRGFVATGDVQGGVGCHNRLIGTEGMIEVGSAAEGAGVLRIRTFGGGEWEDVDTGGEGLHAQEYINRAVADAVDAFRNDGISMMDAHNAIHGTEAIFACWESARRRARVDVPIEATDNPLNAMVESGDLNPQPSVDGETF
ncbi:MAG: Gfo/Idh/MocA family protein [Armatimonadota bacterium]|jgi:UDP-N-acetylglucosamine 3-dehydrogenase